MILLLQRLIVRGTGRGLMYVYVYVHVYLAAAEAGIKEKEGGIRKHTRKDYHSGAMAGKAEKTPTKKKNERKPQILIQCVLPSCSHFIA